MANSGNSGSLNWCTRIGICRWCELPRLSQLLWTTGLDLMSSRMTSRWCWPGRGDRCWPPGFSWRSAGDLAQLACVPDIPRGQPIVTFAPSSLGVRLIIDVHIEVVAEREAEA